MKAEVSGQTQTAQSTVSRIAFTVPIAIPRPKAQREEDQRREADRLAQDRRDNEAIQRLGRDINGDNGMY